MVKFRPRRERVRCQTVFPSGIGRTVQSMRDETDINRIVDRYQRTGDMPPNPRGLTPQYTDCSGLQGDLTEMHNEARENIGNFADAVKTSQMDSEAKRRKERQEFDEWKQQQQMKPPKAENGPAEPESAT